MFGTPYNKLPKGQDIYMTAEEAAERIKVLTSSTTTEKPPEHEELAEALNFDPLKAAEDMCGGKSYKENQGVQALGVIMALGNNDHKKQILDANDDTRYGLSYEEFCARVTRMGFKEVLVEYFASPDIRFKKDDDKASAIRMATKFCVWWHAEKHILLAFDTYKSYGEENNETINGGTFYYNARSKNHNGLKYSPCHSGEWNYDPAYPEDGPEGKEKAYEMMINDGYCDCREGMRYQIEQMEKNFELLPWVFPPFVWFRHWSESDNYHPEKDQDWFKDASYSDPRKMEIWDEARKKRIEALPEEVKIGAAVHLWKV